MSESPDITKALLATASRLDFLLEEALHVAPDRASLVAADPALRRFSRTLPDKLQRLLAGGGGDGDGGGSSSGNRDGSAGRPSKRRQVEPTTTVSAAGIVATLVDDILLTFLTADLLQIVLGWCGPAELGLLEGCCKGLRDCVEAEVRRRNHKHGTVLPSRISSVFFAETRVKEKWGLYARVTKRCAENANFTVERQYNSLRESWANLLRFVRARRHAQRATTPRLASLRSWTLDGMTDGGRAEGYSYQLAVSSSGSGGSSAAAAAPQPTLRGFNSSTMQGGKQPPLLARALRHLSSRRVLAVAAADQHVGLVDDVGALYTFGRGDHFRLGHGDCVDRELPVRVVGEHGELSHARFVGVACSGCTTVAVGVAGEALQWGTGIELGHGEPRKAARWPCRLEALADKHVIAIVAFKVHVAAITQAGELFTWGHNKGTGRLGHGNMESVCEPKLVEFFEREGERVTVVSAGTSHSAAVTASGKLYTWGVAEHSRLGHPGAAPSDRELEPRCVEALAGMEVVAVGAGYHHTAAVTADGSVYTFGSGDHGKLGHGECTDKELPTRVVSLDGVHAVAVTSGLDDTAVLDQDGVMWSTGNKDLPNEQDGVDEENRHLYRFKKATAITTVLTEEDV
jgi:RCC1 and BTB domain-containing protein